MFHQTSLRAMSVAFLLVASITFQTIPLMGGIAMAQKPKPLNPAGKPTTKPGVGPKVGTPTITATKIDAYPVHPSGKADPGDTITYTVTITNSGTGDATGVTFTDSVDTNTTLVPGSVDVQPIAIADIYNVIGNVRIQPNAAQGLLANDTTFGGTVSGPSTSANGGNVSINPDGSFSYNPPVGFTGTDTFVYTLTSTGGKTDNGTATFNVGDGNGGTTSPAIWFIDDSAAPGGDGRLTSPFNCYTGAGCFSAVAADDPGDVIFLYDGTYTGGYTLLNNEKLIGQGASATLASIAVVTVQPYSDPLPVNNGNPASVTLTTTTPATNAVNLGTGNSNTLRGFDIGNTTGADIASTASGFGTLTVSEVGLTGNGQALNLDSGTLAATFTGISSNTSGAQGVALDQVSGTLTATNGTSVTDPATQCILVTASTANIDFGPTTTCTLATDGISLQNNSAGTRTFGSISVTGATGVGFLHSGGGGAVNVTNATTITNPGGVGLDVDSSNANLTFASVTVDKSGSSGIGVDLTNNATRTISFTVLTVSTTNAFALNTNNSGTVNSTGGSLTQNGAGGGAASLTNTALGLNFTTVSSTSGGNGLIFSGGSGTFTSATTNLQGNAGVGLLMSGSAVVANFGNTTVNSSAGDAVDISSQTGNVTFADLDLTPDANLRGLDVSSTTGTITSTSGTIATTDGVAVNIAGPAGLTPLAMVLTSVSADNTGTANACVSLTNTSGSINMQGGTLVGGTAAAFVVSAGTVSATFSGTITQATASQAMVSISGGHNTGTITFNTGTLSATNGTGLQFDNADGTYNFNATNTLNGGDAGVDILNGSSGTFSFSSNTTITNPTGTAFNVSASAPTSMTYAGTITANNNRAVSISNASAAACGTQTFNNSITGSGAAATGILVNNCNAGTINFSGTTLTLSTQVNNGLTLTGNAGATINFSGGNLSLTSTNGNAISATGGGTIGITGNDNTITTTGSGRAVDWAMLTGAHSSGTLRFKSINKSGSGTKGIVVNFHDGSFTVTGDDDNNGIPDSATSGGTITGTSQRGAEFVSVAGGVSLGGMTFTNATTADGGSATVCGVDLINNDNTTCNAPIHLQSIGTSTTLRTITVNGSSQTGINGFDIRAMAMTSVSVSNAGNAVNEHGVVIKNLRGTNTITSSTFSNNHSRQLYVINTIDDSPNPTPTLSITSSTFSNSIDLQGALFDSYNAGNIIVNVGDDTVGGANTFSNNFSNALQQSVGLGGDMTINIKRNTINHKVSGIVLQAAGVGATSNLNYTIWNNTVVKTDLQTNNGSGAIIVSGTQQHQISGDIRSNTIGNGTAGSGAFCGGGCNGITVDSNDISAGGGGRHDVTIVGNTVRNVDSSGIRVVIGQKSKGNVVITGNLVRDPDNAPATTFSGIYVQGGIDATSTSCLAATIGGTVNPGAWPSTTANAMNQILGGWDPAGFQSEIFIWRKGGTFNIPGLAGTTNANVVTHVSARNDIPDATGADVTATGAPFGSGASCPLMLALGGISSAEDMFGVSTPFSGDFSATTITTGNSSTGLANFTNSVSNSLTQPQLDSIVTAAFDRWSATGLTAKQIAAMRELRFEVSDLSDSYLGEADGNRILVDRDAQAKGWFVDATPADDLEFANQTSTTRSYTNPFTSAAGRIDLLTAIEHEIGHKLGLNDSYVQKDRDSIMYGYLTVGERRVPAKHQAANAQSGSLTGTHFLTLTDAKKAESRKQKAESRKNHATTSRALTAPFGGGGTVNVTIGTLPAGDSVTITFQVVVDNPYSGGPNVSNQGTVSGSNFSNVLTDDPDVAGPANPTLTPINSTDIRINDAKQPEPATGTSTMLFTVTLSQPAPGGGLSVNYASANGGGTPATGGASCSGSEDYVTTSGTATIAAGSSTTTIPVTICSDVTVEGDETLLMNISTPSSGNIVDSQATGTITPNTPGTFLISELRTSGPGGAGNDYVELYNNTDSPVTVTATDASAGYGLYKIGATCNDSPVLIGTIPNGTVIPARGHYLVVGSAYSLANYGGTGAAAGNLTMSADIENDRNVAVFSTANVANISSANRLDAVGFGTNTGNVCDLLREGTNLGAVAGSTTEHAFFRKECDFVGGVGCSTPGTPKDTNDNSADFMFADTQGTFIAGVPQRLGAPGPENLASPILRNTIGVNNLDSTVPTAAVPNRVRDFTSDPGNNSTFGTLKVRRRVANNTGAPVTRLRFRIVEMSTFPSPGGGVADLRVRTSVLEASVGPVNDATTCTASGAGSPPCTVSVQGLTLETPPSQPNGGGFNSTVSAGTITLGTPLANGASINVNLLVGIQTPGTFRFLVIVEALP